MNDLTASSEWIDPAENCACGRDDDLVKGWCPDCLPGAIENLMQWAQDRDDVAHDALSRLDGIAHIVSGVVRFPTMGQRHTVDASIMLRVHQLATGKQQQSEPATTFYDDAQGYSPMPSHCETWACHRGGDKAPLKRSPEGFMVCTRCRTSWGNALPL